LKILAALALTVPVFVGCVYIWRREKTGPSLIQLLGAIGVTVVVLTHIAEAFHVFRWMRWGEPDSAGHYLDLVSAVVAVILLPLGYSLRRRMRRTTDVVRMPTDVSIKVSTSDQMRAR
jgi:hypothetical protein